MLLLSTRHSISRPRTYSSHVPQPHFHASSLQNTYHNHLPDQCGKPYYRGHSNLASVTSGKMIGCDTGEVETV